LHITFKQALKTHYKAQVEALAVAEFTNILNFKTIKFLRDKSQAEKTIHPEILHRSLVVKEKHDDLKKGELLLWKSTLATGSHSTNPDTSKPFDKTSPTASMDAVYTVLTIMQCNRMKLEVCDVSQYSFAQRQEAPIENQAINRQQVLYLVDPSAKNFLQKDSSILVQLENALYGLPEAGKHWHEFLKDNLITCGYKHKLLILL
jgi:hypothetical protein